MFSQVSKASVSSKFLSDVYSGIGLPIHLTNACLSPLQVLHLIISSMKYSSSPSTFVIGVGSLSSKIWDGNGFSFAGSSKSTWNRLCIFPLTFNSTSSGEIILVIVYLACCQPNFFDGCPSNFMLRNKSHTLSPTLYLGAGVHFLSACSLYLSCTAAIAACMNDVISAIRSTKFSALSSPDDMGNDDDLMFCCMGHM